MNSFLIKLFGFFLGLLIISIIISFIKVKESYIESFTDTITYDRIADFDDDEVIKHRIYKLKNFDINRFKSCLKKDEIGDDDDDYDDNDKLNIPYKGFKFICINTYNDINKLALTKGRWYDIDADYNNDEEDEKKCKRDRYFTFEKTIILRKNLLNNKIGALGADITNIQLNGPDCYYFANNNKNYELTEFSMFMTVYINSCESKTNNIIYEMTGNTEKLNNEYTTNIININLIKNSYENYDIHLTIGNIIYDNIANNIDKNIIEKNNNLLIGLIYSKDKISLIINYNIYSDSNKNKLKITLGSKPLIINKDGNISMYLYNFVYYKTIYNNINALIRYNIYYLSGVHNKKCNIVINDNNENNNEDIKLDKFNIPKVKFNYSDEYEEPNIINKIHKDDKDDKFSLDNIKNNIIVPTVDRIKSDIETNIKDKLNIDENIKDELKNIKDEVKNQINNKINEEENKPSFFKRLFNMF